LAAGLPVGAILKVRPFVAAMLVKRVIVTMAPFFCYFAIFAIF
jgi:hypothetical protein